jgi:hypothetical protein
MKEINGKKNAAYVIGLISGILAIVSCITAIIFAVNNSYISIYTLSIALILLGINRIGFHLSNFKENMLENILLTAFIFVLAILMGFTKYSIYFLTSTMFLYSLTIIVSRLLKIKEDRSIQSIIFNILCMVFVFLFSFVFFFPPIYEKHATSVSNSNFIIICFSVMILISSSKNVIFPYHKTLRLNVVSRIIKKSMVYEIILALLILVILCSIYFTIVEPSMTSYVDSLWYSFAVITTIGFGDVTVSTTLGRILSVILGISGIVVVALFTSIIVNFYNEMNKKRDEAEIRRVIKKIDELEKIEKEKEENK